MKINATTRIQGPKVVLVPYRKHHVLKYHDWMAKPEIQELTSSEPLTLDEEYNMQKSWQEDQDKLTFIILSRSILDHESDMSGQSVEEREIRAMIGDVNAFIIDEQADEEDDEKEPNTFKCAELEIMIVEHDQRGKGLGAESVYLMMSYILQHLDSLHLDSFIVKITQDNLPSIKMFEKLGFVEYEKIEVFKQVSLRFKINSQNVSLLHDRFKDLFIQTDYNY